MNRTKLSWTIANIEKMNRDRKVLSFDHPIQRKSNIWTNSQKSLLIHSMLANYPIPNIYVLREDSEQVDEKKKPVFNYSVMDGKQRLTSTLSFLWGEFPLDDNIPNVIVEDTEYEIAGKYFCDLDEPVQYEIKRYKFEIIAFEECTNREIEEIFFRLNNSTALTKSQIAKAKVGVELAGMINKLLASKFFTVSCNFSNAQLKSNDDQRTLFQSMMLLDTNYVAGFELKDFSETSILAYSASIREQYSDRQENMLESAIQYLGDAFPERHKQLRKISIPMLVYLADICEDYEIKPKMLREWWSYFTEEDGLMDIYKTFCSSGSTKLEKIKGRLAVMVKSFCAYQKVEIPGELKLMVQEVEEKLASGKEEDGEVSGAEEQALLEEKQDIETSGSDADDQEAESPVTEEELSDTESPVTTGEEFPEAESPVTEEELSETESPVTGEEISEAEDAPAE